MKTRILIIALLASLAVFVPAISVYAIGSGPASGSYVITNNANNLELTVDSGNAILYTPRADVWKLTEGPAGGAYYYTITTSDGSGALTYDKASNSFYLALPDSSAQNQHWLVTAVSGGYEIESMDEITLTTGDPLAGNGNVLYGSRGINVPGTVSVGARVASNSQYVWKISAPPAVTLTQTPTSTPTPTPSRSALPKAPKPISSPANGSYIRSGDKIELKLSSSLSNASIVFSLIDPDKFNNVTWYPSSTPINTPASGTLEFWAKTVVTRGYSDSDIEHFVFQVQRGTSTPTPTPKPSISVTPTANPPGPLTQVTLKITMNKLQYTVNGTPAMFDVAPYLDSKANRSMIPMRFIAEAFGAVVDWDNATKTQTIKLNGKTFKLTENVPLPDGMGTPVLKQDRFFVPLRYVSQELGASVDWENATQTNTIVYYK